MRCHLHLKSMVKIIISKVQFFFFIRKETYQVSPVWSTMVYPVYFGPFDLLFSLRSKSVYFSLFGPHLSNSVYLVHSIHFDPFGIIPSILAHFGPFSLVQYILLKNGKRQVLIESTINYLSNINCNYRISFGFHNNC